MSLIPSESYSFPDHFTTTVVPSRRPKQNKPEAEKPRKKPAIVALPDPEPEPESIVFPEDENEVVEAAEVPVVPPSPALRRAHAPPSRIPQTPIKKISLPPTLKPKPRWNTRAAAIDPAISRNNGNGASEPPPGPQPAQNVIPMKAAKSPRPPQTVAPAARMQAPAQPPPPKPVPIRVEARSAQPQRPKPKPQPLVVTNPQVDFFEMFEEDAYGAAVKRRRQMKFRRFVACESAALLVLLPLVILGLSLDITSPALRWVMNIFTIAAAILAAVIPIVFYAFTPTLPELER
jgi:hypothetical protein